MAPHVEEIGSARLVFGDCIEWLQSEQYLDYDAVLTDPPYGIAYESGWRTDALWSESTIRSDVDTIVRDLALALCDDVPTLVFGSRKRQEPHETRMVLTWDKGPALGMGALDLPWKPSSEEIYVIGKGFVGNRDEGNVLYCPPVQSMAKNGRRHPNEKPVNLLARLIRKLPTGTILDPFMGSGSTGVAALKMGFGFIGIESDERYFKIACERIRDVVDRPTLFPEPYEGDGDSMGRSP